MPSSKGTSEIPHECGWKRRPPLEVEVGLGDDVRSVAGHPEQRDRIGADGDEGVVAEIGDDDLTGEVCGIDPQGRDIEEILAAGQIGIEAGDRVVAGAGSKYEGVVARPP